MIDHFLRFDTEDAAKADPVVGAFWRDAWDTSRCIPNVFVYTITGYETAIGGLPPHEYEQEIRAYQPGWFINIALPFASRALREVPNNACRIIADREAANLGQPSTLYTAPDLVGTDFTVVHVSPTFAGSHYPFGTQSLTT